jgi:hypothetical protein
MISGKVSLGTIGGGLSGLVTAFLVALVPAWHAGLPPVLATAITAGVGALGYFTSGFLATHKATVQEVETWVAEAEQVLAIVPKPGTAVGDRARGL